VLALACAHNVAQDSQTGNDGKTKGAKSLTLENGEAKTTGIVTYPGGDRVDWKQIEIPEQKRGMLDIKLSWTPPRPGLQLAFDVFDEWNTPLASSKKSGKTRTGRTRAAQVEVRGKGVSPGEGRYFIRVYAPNRGDAGKYKLSVEFKEQLVGPAFDPLKLEIPEPPKLAAVPEAEVPCDVDAFDKNNPACRNVCPPNPPTGWPACKGKCPDPPDKENPACWATMDCPKPPDRRIRKCTARVFPKCPDINNPDPENPNNCIIPEIECEFCLLTNDWKRGDRDKILLDGVVLSAFNVIDGSVILVTPPQCRGGASFKNSDRRGAWKKLNEPNNIPQYRVVDSGLNLRCDCSACGKRDVFIKLGVVENFDVRKFVDPEQNANFICPDPECGSRQLTCKQLVFAAPRNQVCNWSLHGEFSNEDRTPGAIAESHPHEVGTSNLGKRLAVADHVIVAPIQRWRSLIVTANLQLACLTFPWFTDEKQVVAMDHQKQSPILIYFRDEHCEDECKRVESTILSDPKVITFLSNYYKVLVLDVTEANEHNKKLIKKYGISELPTLAIIRVDGGVHEKISRPGNLSAKELEQKLCACWDQWVLREQRKNW
jgi:hypothetical protein